MSDNKKPNGVFSPMDYVTVRNALRAYYTEHREDLDDAELQRLSSLLHRINRICHDS